MKVTARKFLYESGKRQLFLLPNVCTLINAFFGLLAVIKAFEADFVTASSCIVCAACMDMIDGRLARFFCVTTDFGMELDSLCDAVSFCCVPAIVMYCWCLQAQGLLGLVVLGCYLWSGLFRLARFNTTVASVKDYFIGLPTTCSAICIASVVAYMPHNNEKSALYSMLLIIVLSLLMISKVQFPSCKKISKKNSISLLLFGSVAVLVSYIVHAPLLLVVLGGYIILSVGMYLYYFLKTIDTIPRA